MNPQQTSITFNKRVGQNLKRYRQISGLTQTELAQRMTDRGYPFVQQTMLKVENGSRPIKLEEALAFAQALHVSLELLWSQGSELETAQAEHLEAVRAFLVAQQRLAEAEKVFAAERESFSHVVDRTRESAERLKAAGGDPQQTVETLRRDQQ
jgi:transcriptional regulator with XRE-family HTH domain